MPTLKKLKKKSTIYKGENKEKVSKIYNSVNWKKLRAAYIMQNPLCEECLEKGIIKEAKEIHHIKPILSAKDEIGMMELAFNPENLKALCVDCHHKVHKEIHKQ